MEILADSITTAVINASIEKINLTEWLFTLKDNEYQLCSTAHIAAGNNFSKDGKRMSINVEQVAGNLLVQHYVQVISEKDHCKVTSISDSISSMGNTKLEITWEIEMKKLSENSCEFSNHVLVMPTEDFLALLSSANITDPGPVKKNMEENVKAHNEEETPLFAKDIERKALAGVWS